jgi:Peptidase family S41
MRFNYFAESIFRHFILLMIFILCLDRVSAQARKPCSCADLLNESIQKVKEMYAGYDDKVTDQSRPTYDQFIKGLQELAVKAQDDRACYEVIKKYTDWFEDGHVGIWFGMESSAEKIRKIPLSSIAVKPDQIKDSIEGYWVSKDQKQKIVIIRDPQKQNAFLAVTIKTSDSAWQAGMVKAELYYYDAKEGMYRGMFYQNDFKGKLDGFTLNHDRLDHWFGPSFYREGASQAVLSVNSDDVQYKKLSKDFVYLKLGHFYQREVNEFDSLIKANRTVIYSTKNLIIDLRGNPGGNTNASQEMIQLIYTNPIIYPAWQYKSAPGMITETKNDVAELTKEDPYHRLADQKNLLQELEKHPGELVSSGDSIVRTLDSVSKFPETVAFLIDKKSGSSSEFFIFEGKQSKKVTLFGTNSAGVMDYGDAHSVPLSCGEYQLYVAWGRNGWIKRFGFHMNNTGFKPDVQIPKKEEDWIQFVIKYRTK